MVLRNCRPRKLGLPRYVDRGGGRLCRDRKPAASLCPFLEDSTQGWKLDRCPHPISLSQASKSSHAPGGGRLRLKTGSEMMSRMLPSASVRRPLFGSCTPRCSVPGRRLTATYLAEYYNGWSCGALPGFDSTVPSRAPGLGHCGEARFHGQLSPT